jgi:hypothetical protein
VTAAAGTNKKPAILGAAGASYSTEIKVLKYAFHPCVFIASRGTFLGARRALHGNRKPKAQCIDDASQAFQSWIAILSQHLINMFATEIAGTRHHGYLARIKNILERYEKCGIRVLKRCLQIVRRFSVVSQSSKQTFSIAS